MTIKLPEAISQIESLRFMSAINIAAFDYVVYVVFEKAYVEMVALHNELGKEKINHSPVNRHMKEFQKKFKFLIIFLALASTGYVFWGGDGVINDILTILALALSIEDDACAKKLCHRNYEYY